jgi:hypothetical protein
MKDNKKEYSWEILPYSEESDSYCLYIIHHKSGARIQLSNMYDVEEAIIINDIQQLNELIERLQQSKEFFNVR